MALRSFIKWRRMWLVASLGAACLAGCTGEREDGEFAYQKVPDACTLLDPAFLAKLDVEPTRSSSSPGMYTPIIMGDSKYSVGGLESGRVSPRLTLLLDVGTFGSDAISQARQVYAMHLKSCDVRSGICRNLKGVGDEAHVRHYSDGEVLEVLFRERDVSGMVLYFRRAGLVKGKPSAAVSFEGDVVMLARTVVENLRSHRP
ncbi:hypothetical protein ACFY4C_38205 [Actinomadura viridis]|uniref:hypothetical protein n=1 Tax=Actinomadura viridis TaxID=58110 RepID=UPI0036960238